MKLFRIDLFRLIWIGIVCQHKSYHLGKSQDNKIISLHVLQNLECPFLNLWALSSSFQVLLFLSPDLQLSLSHTFNPSLSSPSLFAISLVFSSLKRDWKAEAARRKYMVHFLLNILKFLFKIIGSFYNCFRSSKLTHKPQLITKATQFSPF